MTSGFTMLPVAVPLFLAWSRRLRNGWLLAYAVVFAGVTLVTGFGHLRSIDRTDLAADVVIGAFIGWIGGELLERMRERTRDQEVELRRLNRELQIRATTDALTGLANRRQLDTDLQILSTARLGGAGSSAFIMLDLDRFKRLNDELGHAAGDEALRVVSAELTKVVRRRDTIYRYGGEEFLVVMPDSSLEVAAAAAERIREAVAGLRIRAAADPAARTLTISGGVAFSLSAREHWEAVLAAADSALYEAKATGRDRIWLPRRSSTRFRPGSPGTGGGRSRPCWTRNRRAKRSIRPAEPGRPSDYGSGRPASAATSAPHSWVWAASGSGGPS